MMSPLSDVVEKATRSVAHKSMESIMTTATKTGIRGIVQINRQANEGWLCSVTLYGSDRPTKQVVLDTKKTIELIRAVGAPAPASQKDAHVVEFFNADIETINSFGL